MLPIFSLRITNLEILISTYIATKIFVNPAFVRNSTCTSDSTNLTSESLGIQKYLIREQITKKNEVFDLQIFGARIPQSSFIFRIFKIFKT